MTIHEQVYAQAALLSRDLTEGQSKLLEILCRASVNSLTEKLRDGLTPEDCKADFIAAASLYALAAMSGADEFNRVEEFTAGDVTVRRDNSDAASNCLRYQAQLLISPYLKDRFAFLGV
jgi:hypothetical protein